MVGKVKWFNAEKVTVLLNKRMEMMYLFISQLFKVMVLELWKKAKRLNLMLLKESGVHKLLTLCFYKIYL